MVTQLLVYYRLFFTKSSAKKCIYPHFILTRLRRQHFYSKIILFEKAAASFFSRQLTFDSS